MQAKGHVTDEIQIAVPPVTHHFKVPQVIGAHAVLQLGLANEEAGVFGVEEVRSHAEKNHAQKVMQRRACKGEHAKNKMQKKTCREGYVEKNMQRRTAGQRVGTHQLQRVCNIQHSSRTDTQAHTASQHS
jgi:hypothetical protein